MPGSPGIAPYRPASEADTANEASAKALEIAHFYGAARLHRTQEVGGEEKTLISRKFLVQIE
ncbi:hypothetical protein [Baekduia sp. Peel2402]|uniref:hypothetical protein n=1 Tax=Baekduia sp. Peel2402 TaxID=3458296 RepID=UPI00403E37BD